MIYNNSVLDGFPIVLGSMPVQFGMALTMILSVVVPNGAEGAESAEDALKIYRQLLFVHCLIVAVKMFGEHFSYNYSMTYKSLSIIALFFQLLIMNFVLGDWIYDQKDLSILDTMRGAGWEQEPQWINFRMWLAIETYVFFGSIVSGVAYMAIRAFIPNAVQLSVTFDVFDEKTDHLEANAISVEMFEAYFCPFFASMLLAVNPDYVVGEDTQFIVNFFFYG
jgi:hypothetical protein